MDVFSLVMRLKEEGAAQVKASVDKLNRSFTDAQKGATGLDGALASVKSGLANLVTAAAAGAVLKKMVDETSAAQFAQAQLAAALQSTGNAAGQSVAALNAHAAELQRTTIFADDAVTKAQALLLTFTKVGGETFPRATQAITDVATAMGTDLQSATIQVGKALQDPIRGVTALARSGIQFSESQKQMIERLVETNQLAKAQDVILKELETQFAGSAAAARNTLGGALAALKNAFGDLFEFTEDTSSGVVDAINAMVEGLGWLNTKLGEFTGGLKLMAVDAGIALQKLKAWFTMSDADYQTFVKQLEAYRQEAYAAIVGIGTDTQKAAQRAKPALDETAGAVKTLTEKLVELAGLTALTTKEVGTLRAAEARLTQSLATGTLSLDQRITALKELKAVEEALATARIKYTLAEQGAQFKAKAGTFGASPFRPGFTVKPIDPATVKATAQSLIKPMTEGQRAMEDEMRYLAADLQASITQSLGDALVNGIQAAIQRGANIGDAFKAFGTSLLAGLGGVMIALGQRLMQIGVGLVAAMKAFKSGNGFAMIAAGAAFVALGAALRGAASRALDQTGFGGGGGGAGYSAPAMANATAMTLPNITYAPTAAGSAATIERVNPVSVTIIGPNDPAAQRQMQELLRNADRRGSV